MKTDQLSLFEAKDPLPQGFRYQPDFLSAAEERALAGLLAGLPFKEFEFQGFLGKRRVVSFGWQYVFDGSGLRKADDMPEFLLPLREKAAAFAGIQPEQLQHVLLTEYRPAPRSAGTRTARCSATRSAFPSFRPAGSASGASVAANGSGRR